MNLLLIRVKTLSLRVIYDAMINYSIGEYDDVNFIKLIDKNFNVVVSQT